MNWEMAAPRDRYAETLISLAKDGKDIVVLDADLSSSTRTGRFGKEFPERFFNTGIAEQNMMGIAAGLATTGKIVFASTFAVFATGRAYDQIRQSIAYPHLNVNIVATHAGITVGGDGASHQIVEDMALMSALPGMTVISPVDIHETEKAVRAVAEMDGPAYIRLSRSSMPVITDEDTPFEIGKPLPIVEGTDISIMATGIMVSRALEAAEALREKEVSASVINISTIKPIDRAFIVSEAKRTGAVVTAEEHNIIGGMGYAVASVLSEEYPVPVKMVGIEDTFGESGSPGELLEKYGLTSEHIVRAAEEAMRMKR